MLQTLAIWGGVLGLFASIFAIIIIYLTRKSIVDILDKDAIMFDGNLEIKKQAIEKSFKLLDDLLLNPNISSNQEFIRQAKLCYNELVCVVSTLEIATLFNNFALNGVELNANRLEYYKMFCRADIGLPCKRVKLDKSNKIEDTKPTKKPKQQTKRTSQPAEKEAPTFRAKEEVNMDGIPAEYQNK